VAINRVTGVGGVVV